MQRIFFFQKKKKTPQNGKNSPQIKKITTPIHELKLCVYVCIKKNE
jgi:hypothetical protein